MTLMNKILYITDTRNAHHDRILNVIAPDCETRVVYLDEDTSLNLEEKLSNQIFDLIIYSPLSLNLGDIVGSNLTPMFGLCMAKEINELSSSMNKKRIIENNISNSIGINFDCIYIESEFDRQFRFSGLRSRSKYGADLRTFSFRNTMIESVKNIICMRGWTEIHSNHLILDALLEVAKMRDDFCCTFIVPPDKHQIEDYLHLVKSGHLRFIDYLNPAEMALELQQSDIYISATISDGASVSLLEAMASGAVAVVSDFPSNLEIIEPEQDGFVFANQNLESLMDEITKVLSMKPEELNRIVKKARLKVEKIGDWETEGKLLKRAILRSFEKGSKPDD